MKGKEGRKEEKKFFFKYLALLLCEWNQLNWSQTVIAMRSLNYIAIKCKEGYRFTNLPEAINHLHG